MFLFLQLPHRWRNGHPCSLQYLAAHSLERCAQEIALPVMQNLYLLKLPQVTQDVRPFQLPSAFVQPMGKPVHEKQREKATEQMPSDC